MSENDKYTTADAMTDALVRSGIEHVFLNSGTDYPALIESWAKFLEIGKKIPRIITCPHEMVAMSAAQGYAQVTGNPGAVFVHVDVGTQNIGGALSNAFRARTPALIFAGMSPYTMEGELPGSRDHMIQYIQNVTDQANIVREYVKHYNEIRSGANVQKLVYRALQLAKSDVRGPVYLTAPREVLMTGAEDMGEIPKGWDPAEPSAVDEVALKKLIDALLEVKDPVIVTSYLGRQKESVTELVRLCETLAIGVAEAPPSYMNFPGNHPLHLGTDVCSAVKYSDLVLVIDSDVPWIPSRFKLPQDTRLFYIDIDPVKDTIPLWNYPAEMFIRADSLTALRQINSALEGRVFGGAEIEIRRAKIANSHREIRRAWEKSASPKEKITPQYLAATLAGIISEDTVILNEAVTNTEVVENLIPRSKPGTRLHSGGSSLGWHGGAAIGAKLALPDSEVIALTGDGTFLFSCPSAVYQVAKKYNTPFMTIVFNNGGWTAPKIAVTNDYADGYAAKTQTFWTDFDPSPAYDKIAEAAGGAFAVTVSDPAELKRVIEEGRAAVKGGRCAVLNVII